MPGFIANSKDVFRLFRNMDRLPKYLSKSSKIAALDAGRRYVALVRSGINVSTTPAWVSKHTGDWRALSDVWIKEKGHDRFWYETGAILRNVKVTLISETMKWIEIFAGLRAMDDQDAYARALKNEFGVEVEGQDRPLFRPAIDELAPPIAPGGRRKLRPGSQVRQNFHGALKNAIRKAHSGV